MPWLSDRLAPYLEDTSSSRNLSMEGIRGLAVLMVFGVHYRTVFGALISKSPPSLEWADALANVGVCGVDLFFVLSGYLIYGMVIQESFQYGRFASRRMVRLYPTFLATFGLYLSLSLLFPSESKLPSSAWEKALYLGENLLMLPGMLPIRPMITVAWTLSYEVFFYMSLPLLMTALKLRRWRPSLRLVLLGLMALVGVTVALRFSLMQARMVLFFSGIALYELRSALQKRPVHLRGAGAAAMGFLLLGPLVWALDAEGLRPFWGWSQTTGQGVRLLVLALALPPLLLFAIHTQGPLARLFSQKPLRWLGNVSYSFYLLHGLTLKALWLLCSRFFPNGGAVLFWSVAPLALMAALASSAVLFLLVERRFSWGTPMPALWVKAPPLPAAVPVTNPVEPK